LADLTEVFGGDEGQMLVNFSKSQAGPICAALGLLKEIVSEEMRKLDQLHLELIGSFEDIGHAAHDIKEPLRTVIKFAEFIQSDVEEGRGSLEARDGEYLQQIHEKAAKMREMLDDVLEISRLGLTPGGRTGKLDLSVVLKEAEENLAGKIAEVGAEVLVVGELPTLRSASHRRWVSIFQNLIVNGVVYNHSKTPRVTISVEGHNILISDNGIGIPGSKWEWVFGLFCRLSDREEMEKGAGSGLYMVRKFLGYEGCTISIKKSEMNAGTTFRISIPSEKVFRPRAKPPTSP
jgi:light-regulated signal transduction histidine kinase (bacteriophytochrome)